MMVCMGKSLRLIVFYFGMVPSVVFGVCNLFLGFEGSGPYPSCLTKNPHLERLPTFLRAGQIQAAFRDNPSCEKFPEILPSRNPRSLTRISNWSVSLRVSEKVFVSASHRMIHWGISKSHWRISKSQSPILSFKEIYSDHFLRGEGVISNCLSTQFSYWKTQFSVLSQGNFWRILPNKKI